MTKVAIVEDNPVVRQSFREWIDAAPEFHCVCASASAEEALLDIPRHRPDVALMDIHLPGESGIVCTARLKALLPALQVIMVTIYRNHDLIFQALQAGACGYLLKRSQPEDILRAIAEVRAGGAPMTGEIARLVVEAFQRKPLFHAPASELTQRESEILALLAEGLANKEIGARLAISYDTVRAHLRNVYEKLHVRCRTEAVRKYLHAEGRPAPPAPGVENPPGQPG